MGTASKKQVQPKKHAAKNRAVAGLRRKRIIKDIASGKTLKQAGINAGLNPKNAESQVSQILKEPKVLESFKALLDKICPDSKLAEKYNSLLEAKKVISAMVIAPNGEGMKNAGSMTRDFIEVDDCAVQLKCADSIAKLKGHLIENPNPSGEFKITVVYEDGK